jgi:hypothetical protein
MSSTNIKYSPNDFFYLKGNNPDVRMPSSEDCTLKYSIIPDSSCVVYNVPDDFLKELETCNKNNNISDDEIKGCLEIYDISYGTTYSKYYDKYRNWQDNSGNCYAKELCLNKELADKINNIQNNHLGTDEKEKDTNKVYNNELFKTFNLSVGIAILAGSIYYMS